MGMGDQTLILKETTCATLGPTLRIALSYSVLCVTFHLVLLTDN